MTPEEIERAIETLLNNQASYELQLERTNRQLEQANNQLKRTDRQLERYKFGKFNAVSELIQLKS